jgi:tRNA pseudouridine55 synthase
MYSALKHEGKPLYEYARVGVKVPRPAREVTIHALDLLRFEGDELVIEVRCSKGTYVRTLAEDIGTALGCGAHLTALRRTATAGFVVGDTLTVAAFEEMALAARDGCLLPTDTLVADLPAITVDAERTARLVRGMSVPFPENGAIIEDLRLYGAEDAATPGFLGLGSLADGRLKPCRLLSTVVAR